MYIFEISPDKAINDIAKALQHRQRFNEVTSPSSSKNTEKGKKHKKEKKQKKDKVSASTPTLPTATTIKSFDKATSADISADKLTSMVFVGHANTEQIGDFDADAFVKRFCEIYGANDKSVVKDVYLIGCAAGAITTNNSILGKLFGKKREQCLAQQIVNKLHDAGFNSVKLHSVASPEVISPDSDMIVDITTHGLPHCVGKLSAHIYDSKAAEIRTKLTSQLEKIDNKTSQGQRDARAIDAKLDALRKNAIEVVKDKDPFVVLNESHNTYYNREDYALRNQRHANDPIEIRRKAIVHFINSRIEQLRAKELREANEQRLKAEIDRSKGIQVKVGGVFDNIVNLVTEDLNPFFESTSALKEKLEILLSIIKSRNAVNDVETIKENLEAFTFLKVNSSTADLLKALINENAAENDFSTARKIIAKSAEKEQKRQAEYEKEFAKFNKSQPQGAYSVGVADTTGSINRTPPGSRPSSPMSKASDNLERASQFLPGRQSSSDQASSPDTEKLLNHVSAEHCPLNSKSLVTAREKIFEFMKLLLQEDREQKRSCFTFFYLSGTKLEKHRKLQELYNATSDRCQPEYFYGLVKKLYEAGGTLLQSWKTDRTRTLLENILAGNPEFGTSKAPEEVPVSKEKNRSCCC